jgi:hypothetical protein
MCGNNHKIFLLLLLILVSSTCSFAQSSAAEDSAVKRNKSLVLFVGGGPAWYPSELQTPPGSNITINRLSAATTLRIMWYPQYRLRLGLETGTTTFFSYDLTNNDTTGKVKLTAIPLLFTWSMPIAKRWHVYAGFGSYFITTHLTYKGDVNSKSFSLGSNIALAYHQPLSKNLRLAIEGKWLNAFVSKNSTLSLQLMLAWKFLEWRSK